MSTMLFFGHIGAAMGAVWAANQLLAARARRLEKALGTDPVAVPPDTSFSRKVLTCTRQLDYRLVLVAAMLPDIIDKPIGQVFFREVFSYGRIFAHTLLFLILITVGGLYLYRTRSRTWLLTLAAGTFVHIITDEMWRVPRTLFWPLLGFSFDKIDLDGWFLSLFRWFTTPQVFIPEFIGLAILTYLAVRTIRKRAVSAFFKQGRLD